MHFHWINSLNLPLPYKFISSALAYTVGECQTSQLKLAKNSKFNVLQNRRLMNATSLCGQKTKGLLKMSHAIGNCVGVANYTDAVHKYLVN